MFIKKIILLAIFLACSSILAWFFFYNDFFRPLPIRAKQVLIFNKDDSMARLVSEE